MPSAFDNLPAELYDEICKHLVQEDWGTQNSKSTRPGPDEFHIFDHFINIHRRPLDRGLCMWPRPGDIQLRLVNRAFNRAIMRVYFKHDGLKVRAMQGDHLKRFEEDIFRDDARTWNLASAVGKLNIVLGEGGYRFASIFDVEHAPEDEWEKEQNKNAKLEEGAEHLKAFLDNGMLSRAVQKMPRLESLIIHLPEEWRSDQPITYESDYDYDEAEEDENYATKFGPRYRLDLLESLREEVASLFKTPMTPALSPAINPGGEHLQFLTYLRLTLPCAYDFARINSYMPDTVALRLRHLYMEIIDGTGPGGDDDYTTHCQGDGDDGDEDHPFSNVQLQFPNEDHFSGMCRLVNRCKGLESLGLVGTQRINLDSLDLQSTNGGLKNIYLSRVLCTAEGLLKLLPSSDTEGTTCNIEAFQIEESALWDGTWEAVFACLVKAPSLLHFRVYNLIYSKDGLSSNYHEHNNRVWENSSEIWTENDADRERLYHVIKAVRDRGHVLDPCMQDFLKYDNVPGWEYDPS